MTLIEAIKSGKPFRRMGIDKSGEWIDACYDPNSKLFYSLYQLGLTGDDIIADDWEIQEPKPKLRIWRNDGNGALKLSEEQPKGEFIMNGWQSETSGVVTTKFCEWTDVTDQIKELLNVQQTKETK